MQPRIKANEVNKVIRMKLPVIDKKTFRHHYCKACLNYAGRDNGIPHCMLANCSWDDDKDIFSPVLREMLPLLEAEMKEAEARYAEAKRKYSIIKAMFAKEDAVIRRENDPCNNCNYSIGGPCIGFCYKQMTSHPVDEE